MTPETAPGVLLDDVGPQGQRIELLKLTPDCKGRWYYMRWTRRRYHATCTSCGSCLAASGQVCRCGHDNLNNWRCQVYKAPLPEWCEAATKVVRIERAAGAM